MLVILAHLAPVLLGCAGGYAVVELCPDCEDTAVEPLDGEYLLDLSINEVMASNSLSWVDDDESSPDWIELYNGSELEIDLDGFLLRDELEGGEPSEIRGSLVVPAGGFVLLLADGDGSKGAEYLDMKLSSDGEQLGLYTPDDQALDLLEFGLQLQDMALAREKDGKADSWVNQAMGTPGESNED